MLAYSSGSQLDTPFSDEVLEALKKKNAKGELVQIHDYDFLKEIAMLIDEGKVKVTVSKVYALENVAEAHKESEAGHVRGKLVLEIVKEDK